jgi:hypothetical protein
MVAKPTSLQALLSKMKSLLALVIGLATGVSAILLHLAFPPFGLALAVAGTFTALWALGRYFGSRIYKSLAAAAWFAIFWQGAKYGVGNEILIQGDNLGTAFTFLGTLAIFIAVVLPTT